MKKRRHKLILELIEQFEVGTQEELLAMLRDRGYDVTQATVSRDVKELRLLKSLGSNGVYKYTVDRPKDNGYSGMFDALFQSAMTKVDYAGNICVIKRNTVLRGLKRGKLSARVIFVPILHIGSYSLKVGFNTLFNKLCRNTVSAWGYI